MKYLLDAMQPQGVQRMRKLEDGDDIDLNAALAALVDLRMGRQPDPRIMMRSVRKTRDISVMVSCWTCRSPPTKRWQGQDHTVLDLTRSGLRAAG
jgi:nitric oxide reductase NorD protein